MSISGGRFGRVYRLIRIAAAGIVFGAFVLGAGTGTALFPAAAAAEGLSKIQLLPALLRAFAAGSVGAAAAAAATAILTIVFGRVYCAFLCPFGTLQDISRKAAGGLYRLVRRRALPAFRFRRRARPTRFLPLAAATAALLLGSPAALALFDPYSLFGRMAHDIGRPAAGLLASAAAEPLKVIGVFLSPPEFAANLPSVLFSSGILVLLLIAAFARGRFFCGRVCPAGTLLSLLSRRPLLGITINRNACTRCGLCERVCSAECIDSRNGIIREEDCVRCGACFGICPSKALIPAFGGRSAGRPLVTPPAGPRETSPTVGNSPDLSRRAFLRSLAAGIGVLAGTLLGPGRLWAENSPATRAKPVLFFPRRLAPPVEIEGRILDRLPVTVPPGSSGASRFGSTCTACRLCESRCPTGVLRSAVLSEGLAGILQPSLDFEAGFCEYSCNECGKVCPSGAILPLDLRTKQKTQIGRSHLLKDRCVVYTKGTACGACAEVCPTHAVHMVPYRAFLNQPETDESLCIGCGNCQFACPVEGTKAILVEGRPRHMIVDDRKDRPPKGAAVPDSPGGSAEGGGKPEEFPF